MGVSVELSVVRLHYYLLSKKSVSVPNMGAEKPSGFYNHCAKYRECAKSLPQRITLPKPLSSAVLDTEEFCKDSS